jgi:hypothetical protein
LIEAHGDGFRWSQTDGFSSAQEEFGVVRQAGKPLSSRPTLQQTGIVGLFPSEESLQRLVTAVLVEIAEAWESGKSYLKPKN